MKGVVRVALLLSVLCLSCGRRYAEEDISPQAVAARDSLQNTEMDKRKRLMETNKVLLKKESERIVAYAERRGWQMEHLQGVFIQITDKGTGRLFSQGDRVAVEYDCELLNGTKVSSSKEEGVLNMIIGKGGEFPLGLALAVENLYDGARARVIVPYNMAYGLSGDGKKVPKSASLVYDLRVKKVK